MAEMVRRTFAMSHCIHWVLGLNSNYKRFVFVLSKKTTLFLLPFFFNEFEELALLWMTPVSVNIESLVDDFIAKYLF